MATLKLADDGYGDGNGSGSGSGNGNGGGVGVGYSSGTGASYLILACTDVTSFDACVINTLLEIT